MKREDKDLLLKDLCARLPYGVKIQGINPDNEVVIEELFSIGVGEVIDCNMITLSDVKPYLFPLSSMTEEQKQYLKNRFCYDWGGEPYDLWKYQIEIGNADGLIDWFLENHFDFRCLIPKGLAKDATDLNIY